MRKAVTKLATGGAVQLLLREGFARKQSGMSLDDIQATLYRAQQLEALESSTSLSCKSLPNTDCLIIDEFKQQGPASELATTTSRLSTHATSLESARKPRIVK
jgi:hypothetical protein